jgi:hypothetical protein
MNNPNADEAPGQNKTYEVIVNGRPRTVTEHKFTYLQIVQLAYPGEQPTDKIVFTVTYSSPHGKDGSMVEGDKINIKHGIIFNVRKTDQS